MSGSLQAPRPSSNIPNPLPALWVASWSASSWHTVRREPIRPKSPTFTAVGGDLSKRVVTAITLAPNDPRLTWALAILGVTDSGQRTGGVTVTQEAGGAARGPVVVLLGGEKGVILGQDVFPGC